MGAATSPQHIDTTLLAVASVNLQNSVEQELLIPDKETAIAELLKHPVRGYRHDLISGECTEISKELLEEIIAGLTVSEGTDVH